MGAITLQRDGAVATLRLSNPGKANALDRLMLGQLDEHLDTIEADESVRVLVLRGTPGGTFSSGADIADWAPMRPEVFARDWIGYGNTIFHRLEKLRCPTVAALEGPCFGGGLELALCADMRVGSNAVRLRFPEVSIGAIPGWEGGERLARIAGRGRALEAVLSGRLIDAETAERWGVLNALWASANFESQLTDFVGALTRVSPTAARWAKAAVLNTEEPGRFYSQAAQAVKANADAALGIQAFFAKKPAAF